MEEVDSSPLAPRKGSMPDAGRYLRVSLQPRSEILNIHQMGTRAYLPLQKTRAGVGKYSSPYSSLWKREQRRKVNARKKYISDGPRKGGTTLYTNNCAVFDGCIGCLSDRLSLPTIPNRSVHLPEGRPPKRVRVVPRSFLLYPLSPIWYT